MSQSILQSLLNTSWTLHRLSPLHHGKEFQSLIGNKVALRTYATRLRDHLTGNFFAEAQAGLGGTGVVVDDSLSRTGSLKNCLWETLSAPSSLGAGQLSGQTLPGELSGILVVLEYENITYKAALIAAPEGRRTSARRKQSTQLPLLLTRFPNPLRQTFISFLSANFDTYCSTLRLPSNFLCAELNAFIDVLMSGTSEQSIDSYRMLEDIIKEVQLTLSFSPSVAPLLKSLNINIPRGSFAMFARESNTSMGSEHGSSSHPKQTILTGLSTYLEKHLAIDLNLAGPSTSQGSEKQHARLTKVACGSFVLGGEGKMKLVASSAATSSGDSAGDAHSIKDHLLLRAHEALLRAVLRRAASEDEENT
ncbi:uncharacterized protein ACLA_041680 [Aspergillus clavatus NRRL 1]|uniref:Uncharacterized protein n=1 Tax=Aspergillus clavatus (strain ATCC 1007 / CBS 513.65 / DSM 816 / NCTC 3887 / NRRL 1 / QM 1276 / 107) TaxID=344612 RepID=A1CLC3_ASPCL|nr:uncharacterized protein ACLA_041680 [Aspergillus clavatus NRRL 1]EAW09947.1 conserved hypothetical protein [Aspergillus clavatus NRRL 1]